MSAPADQMARALVSAVETIKATGGTVEIYGVRIEPCDEYGRTETDRRIRDAALEDGRGDLARHIARAKAEALREAAVEVEAERRRVSVARTAMENTYDEGRLDALDGILNMLRDRADALSDGIGEEIDPALMSEQALNEFMAAERTEDEGGER